MTSWFGEIKQLHEPWNYGARNAHAFLCFSQFLRISTSFSEDNMPGHALDIFIENATEMVKVIPLNVKNEDQTLR